jgi:hypothetical protein
MRSLRRGEGHLRQGLSGALLTGACLLAGACGTSAPQTFHPASDGSTAAASPSTSTAPAGSGGEPGLVMPPFGRNAHVRMTHYSPAKPQLRAAVTTAKNFVLAVLYADYTGNKDDRWTNYVGNDKVRSGLAASLAVPSVTTESFRGTVRFWRMHATAAKGAVIVTECVDTQHARNTDLQSGRVLPKGRQTRGNANFYSNTDVLARDGSGHWRVIAIPATTYYPEASRCKP